MRPLRGKMRHLGTLRGSGALSSGGVVLGTADYEIDGYCIKPGDVTGSGEICMAPAELNDAFGRPNLELTTGEGWVLQLRFSGSRRDPKAGAAHADITGGLPGENEWRRT